MCQGLDPLTGVATLHTDLDEWSRAHRLALYVLGVKGSAGSNPVVPTVRRVLAAQRRCEPAVVIFLWVQCAPESLIDTFIVLSATPFGQGGSLELSGRRLGPALGMYWQVRGFRAVVCFCLWMVISALV